MGRTKERMKIFHEPSTHEIFYCLSYMPEYAKILAAENNKKPYYQFLTWLIEKDFYKERNENLSIKQISSAFNSDTAKVTKWIKLIYEDIFDLNFDKPELFQHDGLKIEMYMRHFDDRCTIKTTLPVLPREYETIRFPFVKAKLGTDQFWVKTVEHKIEGENQSVFLWLEGGYINRYREFALDKALFEGWIHFMDLYHKHSFELDDELKRIYRN